MTSISADFQTLRFSTYLGGNEVTCQESASAVAVSPADGSAYVVGFTDAPDFPGASNCGAFPQDAFVVRLSSTGSLTASRCHGGSADDTALDVALTPDVVVVGTTLSADFPSVQALQSFKGPSDAFVASFTGDLLTVNFSSPVGGSDQDVATTVSSSASAVYLSGWTTSLDFPVVAPASCGSTVDTNIFVTKLQSDMTFEYSTYLDDVLGGGFLSSAAAHNAGVYLAWADADDVFVGRMSDQIDPGTVQFTNAPVAACEGGPALATIQRKGGEAGTLIVDYETADGTANAPVDYDGTPGSVFMDDLVCSAAIVVPTVDDGQGEPNETFSINLTGVTGNATVGSPSSVVATILDDDGGGGGLSAQFTVSHRRQPAGPSWQATVDVAWLTLDTYSDVGPSTVTATADPAGLAPGTYTGRITVTSTDATGSPQDILVTLVVANQGQ